MSEVEFWTKYCRAEYLYRTKNQAAAAAEAADDEDLALFTKEDDIIMTEAQRKVVTCL
jgi:transcription initiation factor TFIIH subunit 1